jgi:hypothetical protein
VSASSAPTCRPTCPVRSRGAALVADGVGRRRGRGYAPHDCPGLREQDALQRRCGRAPAGVKRPSQATSSSCATWRASPTVRGHRLPALTVRSRRAGRLQRPRAGGPHDGPQGGTGDGACTGSETGRAQVPQLGRVSEDESNTFNIPAPERG